MTVLANGKKRKRQRPLNADGKRNINSNSDSNSNSCDKKNTKKKKKKQKQKKAGEEHTEKHHSQADTPPTTSSSLMASIFGTNSGSHDIASAGTTTAGTKGSLSLTDSIFDNKNNNNNNNSLSQLFDKSKGPTGTRNRHRQIYQRPNEGSKQPADSKIATATTTTKNKDGDCDNPETLRRILRNRKRRSHHRPLLKKELDFPGVFRNEGGGGDDDDDDEGTALFVMDDEEEQAKETADAIREHGFCVLRNVIPKTDGGDGACNDDSKRHPLRDVVLPEAKKLQKRLNAALKARGIHHSSETFRFREAASRCRGRTDVVLDVFENETSSSGALMDTKEKVLRNPKVFPVIQNLLGGSGADSGGSDDEKIKLVYAGLIFSYPGSSDQPWHQDGVPLFPELHGGQPTLLQASLPPYALNVFMPLEDEDGSMVKGPTEFLPGSHKWTDPDDKLRRIVEQIQNGEKDEEEEDSKHESEHKHGEEGTDSEHDSVSDCDESDEGREEGHKAIIAPVLKQGDALIYDYRVCHRGTANLFGKLEAAKSQNRVEGEKNTEAKEDDTGVRGTRRILYLMYARPWFTDHVNFDYTKNAKSLFNE